MPLHIIWLYRLMGFCAKSWTDWMVIPLRMLWQLEHSYSHKVIQLHLNQNCHHAARHQSEWSHMEGGDLTDRCWKWLRVKSATVEVGDASTIVLSLCPVVPMTDSAPTRSSSHRAIHPIPSSALSHLWRRQWLDISAFLVRNLRRPLTICSKDEEWGFSWYYPYLFIHVNC